MNKDFNYSNLKLGIIGGGQLGKIMSQKAKKMGFHVTVLDPTFNCPAAQVSDKHIIGGFYDKDKLEQLVQETHVTTFELEHVDTSILKELYDHGHKIYPSPYVMELIQNKYEQKKLLDEKGIPVPKYKNVNSEEDLKAFGFPVIQKAKMGGYDGQGVQMLKSESDINIAIKAESFIEELVDINKELAVIVARSIEGEIRCYPVVEMLFDERVNICDSVMAPARISKDIEEKSIEICIKSIEALDGVGIFGVELFLTKSGELLVNEIAPRPHNSGHYTVESCATSQFEQIIRAVTNLPLGSTKLISPSVMVNLLGEEGYEGEPFIEGIHDALEIPELSFHFYGKSFTKPFRKMGHITVLDDDIDVALEKAMKAKDILKIKGSKKYE
ncbi:5-(carboxyamino)imidazole ribonucleotide synthase [Poseidonibacter ostreae]|uniref:N5-carboxyaminoimidazole ribonucleotide synthase n=1 Tax=Poseidonibacter ostreae TaxID=2654171 RepID=A0A6L4WS72_9BACT|nr:5-(carboxyamino)imidazole ribonucleotide synthase [Poseidonibacter ostreae]KAB7885692.1 5-(carboxyamino)imidazole ribonucleotide synthase [Poseidonibacter ostreae]MAC83219.1 5-(carboxyamino)imidazole ribonucleotide synthase [Arcobacter sp.]|tara:strand:- start:3841 stop:4995 length:1155 start_codon:yes stop_codon:yes gene_type:complete